ncbi:hypothetical protein DPMN_056971 [Dreissena polymorpha]|uniref:B box-type domain-containing protein n=1 Tax=Dreissena polymorpha TaxID=45954 RepID=A0A9D4CSP7_DREPO|nr:hypothetical protein DPMN_056971 [Dreissena polymorpha]
MATVSGSSYSIAKGSECEIPVNFYCSTCEDHSKKIDADFYCEICLKFFCITCNQLHGQLHVKHTALGRKDKNRWPVSKNVEEFLLDCEDHKDKKVEMYCPEHSKLCCANCVLLNHRTCRKVALISEICTKESTDL